MRPTPILLKRPPSTIRRLPLTTKSAGKDYYKGTGSGSMGRHTKHGGYVIDYNKVRTYMVPSIPKNFPLTPFVTKLVERKHTKMGSANGPVTGELYLRKWRQSGADTGPRE